MSIDPKNSGYAARLNTNGFAFSVRRFIGPVVESGQAFVDRLQARSRRKIAQKEIDDLPDYLRLDIGMPRSSANGKHHDR